jgi:DNA adenine methylase
MRPDGLLFSYPGSKWRLAPRFQRLFASHKVFVDVFGGSAAMLARQQPRAGQVYNDLDSLVHNVFFTVKDAGSCGELLQLLTATSNDREQYQVCKRALADANETSVRRAWGFLTCGNLGFSGHPAIVNSWVDHTRQRRRFATLPARIRWWHERLRTVHLEHRTWQEVVDLYDSLDTLFFLDPPYLSGVLRSAADQYYRCRMDAEAHVEMIERLRTIEGRCMICGYNHPLYTQRLFHWRKITFTARETMGGRAGKRQEVVWLNYESDGSRIEGTKLRIAKRYVQIMQGEEAAIAYVERIKRLRQLPK